MSIHGKGLAPSWAMGHIAMSMLVYGGGLSNLLGVSFKGGCYTYGAVGIIGGAGNRIRVIVLMRHDWQPTASPLCRKVYAFINKCMRYQAPRPDISFPAQALSPKTACFGGTSCEYETAP